MPVREIHPANMPPVAHIRLGNTFQVIIHLAENALPEDFTTAFSRKLTLRGERTTITPSDLEWQAGRVVFWVRGAACKELGAYTAEITYLKTEDARTLHRAWDGLAFVLVEHSWQQHQPTMRCGNVEVPAIKVGGIVIQYGQTAYQSFLLGGGDTNVTEEEFNLLLSEHVTNQQQVDANTAAIIAEIARAQQSEDTIRGQITSEVSRAKQAEAALSNQLADEIKRSTDSDAALSGRINTNAANITAEANRAKGAEGGLSTQIVNEIQRSTTVDATQAGQIASNASAIVAEASRAKGVEAGLQAQTNTNTTDIASTKADLIEVREIAEGANRGWVFDSTAQLDDWLAGNYTRPDGKTATDLLIGDNIYTLTEGEPDYWWDGTTYQPLETPKVDLTGYVQKTQADLLYASKQSLTEEITRAEGAEEALGERITDLEAEVDAIPAQVQADAAQSDAVQPDYIKNLAAVARTGSFNDLKDVPAAVEPHVKTVTNMFTATGQAGAKFLAQMSVDDTIGGATVSTSSRWIEIRAKLDPAAATPLQLVPELGFGAAETWPQIVRGLPVIRDDDGNLVVDANGKPLPSATPSDFLVDVEVETAAVGTTPATKGLIVFPSGCPGGVITYEVGTGLLTNSSYLVDTNGLYKRFHAATTPIENLGTVNRTIVVGGVAVSTLSLKEIHIGDSYNAVTVLPSRFFAECWYVNDPDLSGLKNVTQAGSGLFAGLATATILNIRPLSGLTALPDSAFERCDKLLSLDAYLPNATAIGRGLLDSSGITYLDISSWGAVQSVGAAFCNSCTKLASIKLGSVDWSTKTITGGVSFLNVPNVATSTLYVETPDIAAAFKIKYPQVSNWSVVTASAGMFFNASWVDFPPFVNGGTATLDVTLNPELFTIPSSNQEASDLLAPAVSGAASLTWAVVGAGKNVALFLQLSDTALGSSFTITLTGSDGVDYSYTVNIDANGYPDKPAY